MAVSSSVLCALAFSGQIQVWHIAVGGIAAGIVWAMELAVRRRKGADGELASAIRVLCGRNS
jgi:hypothetical protein